MALSLPPSLAPLRYGNFALYIVGQSISNVGITLEAATTSWLLYRLTDSPILLGLIGLFRAVPLVAFMLVSGALADRLPKRQVLLITQSLFVVASGLITALVMTGLVEPWHLYVYVFVNSTISVFDYPARMAMFPGLVPREHSHAAVSINSVAWRTSLIIGPAIAGIIISTIGEWGAYLLDTVSYLALIVGLLAMRLPTFVAPAAKSIGKEIQEGLGYIRQSRSLTAILLAEVAIGTFGYGNALLTVFARDVLQVGPEGFGLLRSSAAVGAVLGTTGLVIANRIGRKHTLMVVSSIVYALTMTAFGFSRSLELSLGLLVILGSAEAIGSVTRTTTAYLLTPERFRGRVMALVATAQRMKLLSDFPTGGLIAALGPVGAVVAGAAAVSVAAAAQARMGRHADAEIAVRSANQAADAASAPTGPLAPTPTLSTRQVR